MSKPKLKILLARPRGFCAGVDRAIQIVEQALEKYGAPVYVRHEIVHNRRVIETLEQKGAVFIEELTDLPAGLPDTVPVIFSAHGVPKSVPEAAQKRNLFYIDATCPLVSKVHLEIQHHARNGYQILLIGHAGHPEVIGTMGQVAPGRVILIETLDDIATLSVEDPENLAYVTQTTLSVDDTSDMIAALKRRFPNIRGPKKEDICYATTNRQVAVKNIAARCDVFLVLGAPNSSNSNRLVEVARAYGCADARLVQTAGDIDWMAYKTTKVLGMSAGASAPETLVAEVLKAAAKHYDTEVEEISVTEENTVFKLPRVLAA